jgi:hypothetical protein
MRKILIVTAALAAAYGVYRWDGTSKVVSTEHDSPRVKDRLWIDHLPRSETDKINVFVALSQRPRQPPLGIFEQVSMWEGHFEAFRYEQHEGEWRIVLPQSGDKETLTIKASECRQSGMDYCLEVEGASRGPKRYYSRRGWEIRSLDAVDALRAKLLAQ